MHRVGRAIDYALMIRKGRCGRQSAFLLSCAATRVSTDAGRNLLSFFLYKSVLASAVHNYDDLIARYIVRTIQSSMSRGSIARPGGTWKCYDNDCTQECCCEQRRKQ